MKPESHLIAGWRFHPDEAVLRREGDERQLEDRAARVLAELCRRRGEVVGKADLIAEVWGGRMVSPNSVSIVMGALRRALDDDPDHPAIIVTVNKRGYRLAEAIDAQTAAREPERATAGDLRRAGWLRWAGAGALLVLPVSLALLAVTSTPAVALHVEALRNDTGRRSLDALTASLAPVVIHGAGRLPHVRLVDGRGGAGPRLVVRSRLILWNGAPELALDATDLRTHTIVWSGFAAGPEAALARHVEERISEVGGHLPRR